MIYFNSRDTECKKPFGAVKIGTEVYFSVKADSLEYAFLIANDKKHKMNSCEGGFEITISFETPELVLYCFELHTWNGLTVYAGKGSMGMAYFSLEVPEKYQLTVYRLVIKIIFLVVFFAVMIGIGIMTRKKANSVEGFVLGGRFPFLNCVSPILPTVGLCFPFFAGI